MENYRHDLLQVVRSHLAKNDIDFVVSLLNELHASDIADVLEHLDADSRLAVFNLFDDELSAEVLSELDEDTISALLGALAEEKTADILDEMSFDDAADMLAELPESEKNKLLDLMEDADAEDVQELMGYGEETAGGIMTTEYVAIRKDITVDRAMQTLRETAADAETIYYVYVINEENQLVGVISLRQLILADPRALVEEIMQKKVISVKVDMDQEEVAKVVHKYDFLAVPVVNNKQEILGIVTFDDVSDVVHEEHTEDLYRLAGIAEVEDNEDIYRSIRTSIRSRLPWLLITLVSGLLSGQIIRSIENALNAVVALAFFIPLLTGMGGNLGTQSSTLIVRGIATGEVDSRRIMQHIMREALVGLTIGLVIGIIVALVAVVWQGKPILGLVVGAAMWGNLVTAATIGTFVPLVLKRFQIDPAVASAPFISTMLDNTGLIIYATLTTILLRYLV